MENPQVHVGCGREEESIGLCWTNYFSKSRKHEKERKDHFGVTYGRGGPPLWTLMWLLHICIFLKLKHTSLKHTLDKVGVSGEVCVCV